MQPIPNIHNRMLRLQRIIKKQFCFQNNLELTILKNKFEHKQKKCSQQNKK